MDFIQTSNKQTDKFGPDKHGFKPGNPGTGELATFLSNEWCDTVQQEIVNVVEGAGLTPTAGVRNQMYLAIQAMIYAAVVQDYKASARYTTTANITLSGLGTQAGGDWPSALTANDRILVKDQTTGSQNGIYIAAAGAWTRATDADGAGELTAGAVVLVEDGAAYADSQWMLTTDGAITIGSTTLTFARMSASAAVVANVRQTVASGSVDTNGQANFLSIGTGLAVNLAATATPVTYNFSAGYGTTGAVDYVGRDTADIASAWSALTASSTLFLYRDRNTGTGVLTTGFSALAPVYQNFAPSAPATDQHWFDTSTMTMKRWSGAAWVVFQRVFVGECVTGASTVTSVFAYALKGQYLSTDGAFPATSTKTVFNHYIGVQLGTSVRFDAVCITAELGWAVGEVQENITPAFNSGSYVWTASGTSSDSRNVASYQNGQSGTGIVVKTAGTLTNLTAANWKIRCIASRGF
jgi:phage-related tail fiber protein